jgi:TolB protein
MVLKYPLVPIRHDGPVMKPAGSSGRARGVRGPIAVIGVFAVCACARVTAAAPPDRHATLPAASPDGRHVAFIRDLPDHASDVYVVDLHGGHLRQIVHLPHGGAPSWRAGGRSITFVERSGDSATLVTMPVTGGARQALFSGRVLAIALSHDGRRVVYTQGGWTQCRMLVADLDGANARALTDSTFGFFNMAWSPDDRTIAVTRRDTTGDLQVWSFDIATGAGRPITAFDRSAGRPQWPAWSPDGRRLAIQVGRYDRDHPELDEADIWVMDPDGGHARNLTRRERPWMDETPSWLPDGRRIAFQSTRAGRFEIWVMNADGTGARQVTR